MAELPRETHVLDAVVSLVDTLLDDFDVVDLLIQLTEQCAALLDIASAGLLLADPRSRLHLMAATTRKTRDLELFQLQSHEGPCLDSYASGQPISVVDLQSEHQRWPRFAAAATEAGFASIHAVPIRAASTVLGALGLFGTNVGKLNSADLLVGRTLAHVACVAILQERAPTAQTVLSPLRNALVSRIVVDQATGFLHEHFDLPLDEAFTLLRRYARDHNKHLTDVSRQLVTEPDARRLLLPEIARVASDPSLTDSPTASASNRKDTAEGL
ncbi:GAF and ANTAR domain-containing protein [Mycolicibacterium stellerae]|uniref:GAF and ANTAR domain-containing protein n=1 Tax=Mycolicibacterium stellerae TaxID=2358193 RepID=UPI000F0B14B5|nr:GAF and ANTAR domain-containing protein [Mycolicibacterium stellerae]